MHQGVEITTLGLGWIFTLGTLLGAALEFRFPPHDELPVAIMFWDTIRNKKIEGINLPSKIKLFGTITYLGLGLAFVILSFFY